MTSHHPRRLFLLRHAHSGWAKPGQRDHDRVLDDTGRQDAAWTAMTASLSGYRPTRIISSTAQRCLETAASMSSVFGLPVLHEALLYNAPPENYLDQLAAHGDTEALMLVGHNPAMEELLVLLAGAEGQAAIPDGYPTAGLAVLDRQTGEPSRWSLTDFIRRPA